MVKFSKELEAQLIPEWKEAFMNYWQLKKEIKKIKQSKISKQPQQILLGHGDFGRSIFDPIRSFCSKLYLNFFYSDAKVEIIQVKRKGTGDGDGELYQTELIQLFSEDDENRHFFEKLDQELNKVNQFYKTKEKEFVERGEMLSKQLEILLDLKQLLSERRRRQNAGIVPHSLWSPRTSNYSETRNDSTETPLETSETDDVIAALERNGVTFINSTTTGKTKNGKPKMALRVDIPATTPTSALTSVLWEDDLVNNPKKESLGHHINRKKLQCAEKMIRSAFVQLYRGLVLLKNYSSLNMVAFTKILKKFDKVSNQQASASYLKTVKRSHFISSDKVVRLMDEVESIFTKHFASNDSKMAMKFLRPDQQQKESHMVTFFVGLFMGCFLSLFTAYIFLAHLTGLFSSDYNSYVETVYPVFSVFALISLHLFVYGCNLFMWKRKLINYNFIFDFQPNTSLKYRDALLICTTFLTSVVAAMVIHLLLRVHNFSPNHIDMIPGILILILLALLICPFDIFYRSTRYCFIRVMRNIVCSPFYKVLLVDFFMADQLTSQIPMLRYMEFAACYFLAGSFKTHELKTCESGSLFRQLAYVISFLPYYFRAMQCARRWHDESDPTNLANMGKYVSAMIAACARIAYANNEESHVLFGLVLVTSVIATLYQLYWDFVKDWGLFNPKSKNPWLRDKLILKNKSIYYVSIVLNVILRVAWVETVLRIHLNIMESRMLEFFLASLEVIRRGHWNFYRLENEQLNNCGNFRAVKAVPLPFCETDFH